MRIGVDLRTMGLRRIRVLVAGLPRDSVTVRASSPQAEWSTTDHLLAGLIEVLDQTSWRSVLPHVKRGWKPPPALKIPRPGEPEPKRERGLSMAAFRRLLGNNVEVVPEGGE